jgi:hypothetical protein
VLVPDHVLACGTEPDFDEDQLGRQGWMGGTFPEAAFCVESLGHFVADDIGYQQPLSVKDFDKTFP